MEKASKVKTFYVYAKKYCPRRSLESSKLFRYLVVNDLKAVKDLKKADLILIYTCGGFTLDEEFSLMSIEKALKNKSAKIVITGCLPKIDPQRIKVYENAVIVPPENLATLDSLIGAKVPYEELPDPTIVEGIHDLYHGTLFHRIKRYIGFNTSFIKLLKTYADELLKRSDESLDSNTTYKLVIAKGCLGDCSFCAIRLSMEKFRSFSEGQIIEKFQIGLKKNFKTFALIAGDIGCYGVDIGTNLPNLLRKLFDIKGDYKIILVDLNVRWFVKYYPELLSILKANSARVSRIIMPIQSGSNRILKLMNRHYDIDQVKKCLLDFQKNVSNIMIETHIIVGFPGETEADFQESLILLRDLKFSKVYIYQYEDRPGTLASDLPVKVDKATMNRRTKALLKVARNATVK